MKKKTKNPDTSKNTSRQGGYIKVVLATFLVFLMILVTGGVTGFAFIQDAPNLSEEQLKNAHSSAIYDMNGEKIADLAGSEHRIPVQIEDVPEHVKKAFIAVEDARFHEHSGIDIKRIAGAALANIKEGWGAEGGSTITQQVVKNTYLSPEKTIKRKIQEAYLSIKMERKYTKDEILEMYLNKIYFGNGAYGIGAAADVYFNKRVDELTIAEAALLAGLPQRPSGYDPKKYPDKALERRNIVLSLMEKHGFISKKEEKKAEATKLENLLYTPSEEPIYQSFIDHVIEELTAKGIQEDQLYTGGLKIYTTLDPDAQAFTEKMLEENEQIPYPNDQFKAGIVLLDTKTGAIRAIGGNRKSEGEQVKRGFNYATDIKRQPGSTIKPILDYAPAIEYEKWSTYHQIEDEELEIDGKEFQNWDEEFHGMVSMREALIHSYNIPAIKTFMEIGGDRAVKFANQLGVPVDHAYPAYAIGGFESGVSPLHMAGAYAAFGNKGVYNKPYTLKKIEYPNGETKTFKSEPKEVMNQYTAYMITDMLKDVLREGTGTLANIEGLPVAGKTGTTNPPEGVEDGSMDAWFVGYTTQYTAAVWTGYEKTTTEQYVTKEDSKISKLLFKSIMEHVSKGQDVKDFEKPSTVKEVKIDKRNGQKASSYTPSSSIITELFVKGTDIPSAYKPETNKSKNDSNKKKERKDDDSKKEKEKKRKQESDDKKESDSDDESDGSDSDNSGDSGSGDSGGDGSGDSGSDDSGGDGSGDSGSDDSGGDGSGDSGSDDSGGDGSGDSGSGDSGGDGSGDSGSGDSGGDGSGDSGSGDSGGDGSGDSGSGDSGGDGSDGSGSGDSGSDGSGGSGSGDSGSDGSGGSGSGDSGSDGSGGSGSGDSGSDGSDNKSGSGSGSGDGNQSGSGSGDDDGDSEEKGDD
ncbi:PBP1A family penicillin-binding protein [Pseudalkalibacillus sp. SCS-8]|uniref:transglycosylase domain-containing protein n=1 Tax=Pseudalkalibacillus nanhaiensis TaxID=3115291 RepID=UPI0032DA7E5D